MNLLPVRSTQFRFFKMTIGGGVYFKGAYGTGKSAQITLTAGLSKFTTKNYVEIQQATTRLIPFFIGYKQNIQHFFIEPQIGFGETGGKMKLSADFVRPSVAAVFDALNIGYVFNRFNAGIRFEKAHGVERPDAGTWHEKNFHYTALFVGYSLLGKHTY